MLSSGPPWRNNFFTCVLQRASATKVLAPTPAFLFLKWWCLFLLNVFSCLETSIENIEALKKMIHFVHQPLLCRQHRFIAWFRSGPGFHPSLCPTEALNSLLCWECSSVFVCSSAPFPPLVRAICNFFFQCEQWIKVCVAWCFSFFSFCQFAARTLGGER